MNLRYHALSDPGCIRDNNEDYIYTGHLRNGDELFIVADGMGGHHAGEVASRQAVTKLVNKVEMLAKRPGTTTLVDFIKDISREIYQANQLVKNKQRMGTTLTALLIKENQAFIAHVGDSRIYRYRTGPASKFQPHTLTQLTEDHSVVGELLRNGTITEAAAREHPKRNVLNQAVGMRADVSVQTKGPITILPGDKYLLCSDGLSSMLTKAEIEELLISPSLKQAAQALVNRAKTKGGPDNISLIIVDTTTHSKPPLSDETKPELIIHPPPGPDKTPRFNKKTLMLLMILLLTALGYLLIGHLTFDHQPSAPNSPEMTTQTGNTQ